MERTACVWWSGVDARAWGGHTHPPSCVSSSVEPGTRPSQEMVGPDAARDGDTASPYGTKRKEREASPSVAIGARAIAIMARAVVAESLAFRHMQPTLCAVVSHHVEGDEIYSLN